MPDFGARCDFADCPTAAIANVNYTKRMKINVCQKHFIEINEQVANREN